MHSRLPAFSFYPFSRTDIPGDIGDMKLSMILIAAALCLTAGSGLAREKAKPPKALDLSLGVLAEQVKGEAVKFAGNQLEAKLASGAGASESPTDLGGQVRSQVAKAMVQQVSQELSGDPARQDVTQGLRQGLSQTAGNALAAPVTQKLGAMLPIARSPAAAGMQQAFQQGISTEVQKRLAGAGADSAPGMRAQLQGAATASLKDSAQRKIAQAIPASKQPLAGDLLMLGLKLKLPKEPLGVGSFAAPQNSALPVDIEGLRSGLSIVTNGNGKAGLGLKSSMDVGSQKIEISGSLDPDSKSDQGKSAGVQIRIGGN